MKLDQPAKIYQNNSPKWAIEAGRTYFEAERFAAGYTLLGHALAYDVSYRMFNYEDRLYAENVEQDVERTNISIVSFMLETSFLKYSRLI